MLVLLIGTFSIFLSPFLFLIMTVGQHHTVSKISRNFLPLTHSTHIILILILLYKIRESIFFLRWVLGVTPNCGCSLPGRTFQNLNILRSWVSKLEHFTALGLKNCVVTPNCGCSLSGRTFQNLNILRLNKHKAWV